MADRFALYLAPPADDPLHGFAAAWLGRDPETGESVTAAAAGGLSASRIAALTAEPRRYGLHATLKPPFRLADGCSEAQLILALEQFAGRRRPFRLPPLQLAALGGFLALRPSAPSAEADDLAAACVREFDPFRASADEGELVRRRAAGLTPRQEEYLLRWGYPYVLEEFRLHFTLTGRVTDEAERSALLQHLERETKPFTRKPVAVDEICLFVQPAPDANFRIAGRYRLGG